MTSAADTDSTPCMFALPVYDNDAITIGFVRVSGSRWGAFDTSGLLIATAHREDSARKLVLAHADARACVS